MENIIHYDSILLSSIALMIAFFTYDSLNHSIKNFKERIHRRVAFFLFLSQLFIAGLGVLSVQLIIMKLYLIKAIPTTLISIILLFLIRKCWFVIVKGRMDKRMISNIVFGVSITFLYFLNINNLSPTYNLVYPFTPLSSALEGSFFPYLLALTILLLFINQQIILTVQEKKKRLRKAVFDQEFQYLYQHYTTVVISSNLDGRITHANQVFLAISGYSINEVKGKYLQSFLSSESKKRFVKSIENIIKGDTLYLTVVLTTKVNTIKYLAFNIYPIHVESKVQGLFVVGNDYSHHLFLKDNDAKTSLGLPQFLTQISHEVRTPLHSILGYAQLMKMDPYSPLNEKQAERIDKMMKSGNHLLQLMNEVVNLQKYEKGQSSLTVENTSIHRLIEDSIHLVVPLALEKKVEIITNLDPNHEVVLRIDTIKMMQALLNLISNAIKFNKYGGTIVISSEKHEKYFRIFISDTGVGMSAKEMEKIFIPFYRSSTLPTDKDGNGIGLTIAKNLIEMMDGEITVKSSRGKGSTFTILFKL